MIRVGLIVSVGLAATSIWASQSLQRRTGQPSRSRLTFRSAPAAPTDIIPRAVFDRRLPPDLAPADR